MTPETRPRVEIPAYLADSFLALQQEAPAVGLGDEARSYLCQLLRSTSRGKTPPLIAFGLSEAMLRRVRFMAKRKVKEFEFYSRRNWLALLKSGGASKADVDAVLDLIFDAPALPRMFDHCWMYGRKGRPVLAVACPYEIPDDERPILDAIAQLGLRVRIIDANEMNPSLYGGGTYQIEVSNPLL